MEGPSQNDLGIFVRLFRLFLFCCAHFANRAVARNMPAVPARLTVSRRRTRFYEQRGKGVNF